MQTHHRTITAAAAGVLLLSLTACGNNASNAPADAPSRIATSTSENSKSNQTQSNQTSSKEHDVNAHAGDVFGSFPQPKTDLEQPGVTEAHVVFAGGCFWCTEAVFEQLKGVSNVVSGYAGGSASTANYNSVGSGNTGHAEVIGITYDPTQISYGQLLRVFFATHDPTQLNRQGNDIGTQYRSAIFYNNEDEKRVAEGYIKQLDGSKDLFGKPIVTTLEPLVKFYEAELYHQDYARQNPDQPYVKFHALPLADKVDKMFPELKAK